MAATIISEIVEIDQFNHPKKLVAFAAVDLSDHSSAKFTANIKRKIKEVPADYIILSILPHLVA
ncbi:transposase [Peribacillus simplex]|uniref:transposase n=1 Tax=Peribacillus simplex TaxID=1478 RepID=UPI001DF4099C|nr:transposase [Peribacillus simplex]CAH0310169.1 hypothetical protein SRABI84_04828 [Peribacillus simplex]